jgi:hypothetical protein
VAGEEYAAIVLADSPWAYWPLNETSGTTAVDATGNGRDATITGGSGYTRAAAAVAAYLGPSTTFNGTDLRYTVTSGAPMDADWTMEGWYKPTNWTAGTPKGLWQYGSSSDGHWMARHSDSGLPTGAFQVVRASSGGGTNTTISGEERNNLPNHVVVTLSGTTAKVYLNGVLVDTWATTANAAGNAELFWGWCYSDGRRTVGEMQHLAIYTSALTQAQIEEHYIAGMAGSAPTAAPGILAWYRAEDVAGADGTAVTAWDNAETTATRDLTAVGSGVTVEHAEINGKKVVRFTGAGQLNSSSTPLTSEAFTLFIVHKPHWTSGPITPLLLEEASGTTKGYGAVITSGTAFSFYDRGVAVTGLGGYTNDAWQTLCIDSNGTSLTRGYTDGSETGAAATYTSDGLNNVIVYLGGTDYNADRYVGDIAEVIVYDRRLTDREREGVGNYLADRFDLPSWTSTEPSGDFTHPLWHKNGVATALAPNQLRVIGSISSTASSAFWDTRQNLDEFYFQFVADVSGAADGFTFALAATGPTQLGSAGGSLGALNQNGTYFAFDKWNNRFKIFRYNGSYTEYENFAHDPSGVHEWGFYFTRTAYETYTVDITRDGVAFHTETGLPTIDNPWVGFTGATGGSSMTVDISDLAVVGGLPPSASTLVASAAVGYVVANIGVGPTDVRDGFAYPVANIGVGPTDIRDGFAYPVANIGVGPTDVRDGFAYPVANITVVTPLEVINVWNGSAWVKCPLWYWNGFYWSPPLSFNYWDGDTWEEPL